MPSIISSGAQIQADLPTGYKDEAGMERYAEHLARIARSYRFDLEREAVRNVLFFLGMHWIKFDTRMQTWRPIALKRSTPRPVTNKFASIVEHICSSLEGFRPPLTVSPATQSGEDLAAALAGDKIRNIIEKEVQLRKLRPLISKWLTLTGNAFLINSYDMSPYSGFEDVQLDRCIDCKKVVPPDETEDHTNETNHESGYEPALDNTGAPIEVSIPRGRHYTEVKSILETYFDYEAEWITKSPYFLLSEMRTLENLQRIYGKEETKDLVTYHHGDPYSYYTQALAYTAGGGTTTRILAAGGYRAKPRVRVRRMWLEPSEEFPQGLYCVIAGNQVMEVHPWKYHKENGDPFLNIVHMKFSHSPGRLAGKSRMSDVVPKQEQRNRVESIIELHSRRMANAVWLVPHGVGLSKLSGEQGQLIRYNALAGVPPPKRESGDAVPPYLVHWLAQIDQEMDDIVGSYEVGRGEAPRGVSAYAALQLLDERARQGQSGLFENWSLGFLEWTRQHLDIWREHATQDRYTNAGIGAWGIQQFSKAQLQGAIDIDVEIGHNRPHTSIGRRAILEQAMSFGAINVQNPMERYQVLELLGVPEMMEDHRIDMEAANKENDAFVELGPQLQQGPPQGAGLGGPEGQQGPGGPPGADPNQAPPMVPPPAEWDNHGIHITIHRRFYYSDKFQELPDMGKYMVVLHMTQHMQIMQMQMAAQGGGIGGPGTPRDSKGGTDEGQVQKEAQGAGPRGPNQTPPKGGPPGGG